MNARAPAVPRRWTVEVDGIKWLPRLIDKARMSADGELGGYLLGHSPVDFALLRRLAITTPEFAEIATHRPDDESVLAALRARGFDEPSVRRWSDRFESTYRLLIPLWDVDEGYRRPSWIERPLFAGWARIEGTVVSVLRKVRPVP